MSPPIRDGSGNDIGAIRLGDGSEISEVRTGAGDVLFSGSSIPDSGELFARYDPSKESTGSISTLQDRQGSNDLTSQNSSRTTILDSSLNGLNTLEAVSAFLDVSFPQQTHPITYAFVVEIIDDGDSNEALVDGATDFNNIVYYGDGLTNIEINAGSGIDDSSFSAGPNIITTHFDGSDSVIRLNGSQVASGDAGDETLSGLTLAGSTRGDYNQGTFEFGEFLLYNGAVSNFSDIESYLSDKWGITI